MVEKYKLERWKQIKYKGQKNQYTISVERLVKRDSHGKFAKNTPVIKEIREKTYGTGIYKVGILNGKVVTRHKQQEITPTWKREHKAEIEARKEARKIYRCSLVLNDIPFRGEVYYGFRITAFSNNKEILHNIYPKKMKDRLIEFIEKCLGYKEDEFWFSMYFGYEAPNISNAYISENGRYYLQWQKRYGAVVKEEQHYIRDLL